MLELYFHQILSGSRTCRAVPRADKQPDAASAVAHRSRGNRQMAKSEDTPAVPAVETQDLTVAYDETPVLWDIDLQVPRGITMGILGPNGAGKSTLLKAVMGIVPPAAGSIRVLGQPAQFARKKLGYIPQRTSVDWDFPTTVLDVVLMGTYGRLGWFRRPGRREFAQAREALRRVGMEAMADRQISELSGGQQQRTFLARALVQDAEVYLMDEPFQGVDALTERAIVDLLRELKERERTLLVVHHDLQTVESYFDWVTLLNVRVVASGPAGSAFTEENVKQAYGGRIELVGNVGPLASTGSNSEPSSATYAQNAT